MSANGRGSAKPTIVLVHGLWLTPRSWEGWIDRYRKVGYNVIAPSWPGLEGEVEAIRKDPSPLKRLKLSTVVDHYERIIRKLDAPPIIMITANEGSRHKAYAEWLGVIDYIRKPFAMERLLEAVTRGLQQAAERKAQTPEKE